LPVLVFQRALEHVLIIIWRIGQILESTFDFVNDCTLSVHYGFDSAVLASFSLDVVHDAVVFDIRVEAHHHAYSPGASGQTTITCSDNGSDCINYRQEKT
jgi:hypothetical protein